MSGFMDDPVGAVMGVIVRVPELHQTDRRNLDIERLGGLSNINYRVTGPRANAVVRFPGPGTAAYVDRRSEAVNFQAAAAAGVAPEVLYSDACTGVLVTRFIENAAPVRVADSSPRLNTVACLLQRLHCETASFANVFDPFALLERYLAILEMTQHPPARDFVETGNGLRAARPLIGACADIPVPSHCDVLPGNLLDDGHRLWAIDFEFSGNCDPLWDLADFSGETGLTAADEDQLLAAYYSSPPAPEARARFGIYKALSLLVAASWARVQAAHDNPAVDFESYAAARLEMCGQVMADRAFHEWIECLETQQARLARGSSTAATGSIRAR